MNLWTIFIGVMVVVFYILPMLDALRLSYYIVIKVIKEEYKNYITILDILVLLLGVLLLLCISIIPYVNISFIKETGNDIGIKPLWYNPFSKIVKTILEFKVYER